MERVINTNGIEYEIIETKKDYTLLRTIGNKYNPWIVAWNLKRERSGKVTWGQGYYLENEKVARGVFIEKVK